MVLYGNNQSLIMNLNMYINRFYFGFPPCLGHMVKMTLSELDIGVLFQNLVLKYVERIHIQESKISPSIFPPYFERVMREYSVNMEEDVVSYDLKFFCKGLTIY
jgi:hypothetical protein